MGGNTGRAMTGNMIASFAIARTMATKFHGATVEVNAAPNECSETYEVGEGAALIGWKISLDRITAPATHRT